MTPERERLKSPKYDRLTPEWKERYLRSLEIAPDMTITLAFVLQDAARIEKEFLSPLYLLQAEELTTHYNLRKELMDALTKIQEL